MGRQHGKTESAFSCSAVLARLGDRLSWCHSLSILLWSLLGPCACGAAAVDVGPARRDIVDRVEVTGIPDEVLEKDLMEGLGTRASSSFLWKHTYQTFDPIVLDKDLLRIERELRRKGYYEAKVRAARIIRLEEIEKKRVVLSPVRVEIEVDLGPAILIGKLETRGLASLPFAVARAAAEENRLREGQLFDEHEFEAAKVDIANSLADRGYAFAQVSGTARVDLVTQRAHVIMAATPGPRAKLGRVSIEGLSRLQEPAVRRVLGLREGDYYSRRDIRLARSALFNLGTFSRVEIIPDLSDTASAIVPLTIRLQESSLHELKLGLGGRFDTLRLATVGLISWSHLNFLGGLRKLTIETRPGLTFFPTALDKDHFRAPTAVFPENFFTISVEQPGFIEARTKGFHEGGYNVYPLLYPLGKDTNPREARVVGYNELTTGVGLSRSFFDNALDATLSLHWQGNFPFTYQEPESGAEEDSLLSVQVIYPDLYTRLQFLDDPVEPKQGVVFSNSIQFATGLFGTLRDIRIRPELRTFIPLDKKHKLVLASRFGVGMLINTNYGEDLRTAGRDPQNYTDPSVIVDQQKMVFRAFYSGGPGSNRGYPYRRVGPQGPIAFLLPDDVDCVATPTASQCERPLGGFTLWEASTELRFHPLPAWSFVAFIDASDVSEQYMTFNFTQPHIAVGPGVRYHSPIGPVRLDLGFRVPGLQVFEQHEDQPKDVSEVDPYNTKNFIDYFAVHLLIGEDF